MNVTVKRMIENNLATMPDECPKCGASHKALEDSLYEGGRARREATMIIENCDMCRIRFQGVTM